MIEPKDLLPLGFGFIDGIPELMVYYINPSICITYADGTFELGLNGCCWTRLNIDSVNDVILTIELLSDGDPIC